MMMMMTMILQCNSSSIDLNLIASDCFGNGLGSGLLSIFVCLRRTYTQSLTHSLSLCLSPIFGLAHSVVLLCGCGSHSLLLYLFAFQNIGMLIQIHSVFFGLSYLSPIFRSSTEGGIQIRKLLVICKIVEIYARSKKHFQLNMLKPKSHISKHVCEWDRKKKIW